MQGLERIRATEVLLAAVRLSPSGAPQAVGATHDVQPVLLQVAEDLLAEQHQLAHQGAV